MTTNKKFTFLPNGQPVQSLKNKAKKSFRQGETKSLTDAQNKISKTLFNKAFNKMSDDIEMHTPVIIRSELYAPIIMNLKHFDIDQDKAFVYYVKITNSLVAASLDMHLDIQNYVSDGWIDRLEYKDIESKEFGSGWCIRLSDEFQLFVYATDDGIVVDLFDQEGECAESTYLFYDELIIFYMDYDFINDNGKRDKDIAKDVQHSDEMDRTLLATIGSINLYIYGEKETVFLGMESEEDYTPIGEVFDELPATLNQKMLFISEYFA